MKIAYLLLVHDQPQLSAQLIHAINSPTSHIFIHVDAKTDEAPFRSAIASSVFSKNVSFIKERVSCSWGRSSLVHATLHLLKEAYFKGAGAFDYFILLSGRDFPIKSNAELLAFLEKGKGVDYMEHFPLPSTKMNERQGGSYRFNRYHYLKDNKPKEFPPYSNKPILNPFFNAVARLYHLTLRKLPMGMKAYGGSQWWMLSGRTVAQVLEFLQANPSVVSYFDNVWIPDEIFFQTVVLHVKGDEQIKNSHYRFIRWVGNEHNILTGKPKILTEDDYETMIRSEACFGRKLDEKESQKLIALLQKRHLENQVDNNS